MKNVNEAEGMRPFERILVGVDAEGLSEHALSLGVRLANQLGSRLDVLHAVDLPPSYWPGIDTQRMAGLREQALIQARHETLDALRPAAELVDCEGVALSELLTVRAGHPAREVLRWAEEHDNDLILIGPHAKRSVLDFGSTARAILSGARVPVWTQTTHPGPIETILVPTDFSAHSRSALEVAGRLATRLGASLRVMHSHVPVHFAYGLSAEAVPATLDLAEREREACEQRLAGWIDEHAPRGVRTEPLFLAGDPTGTILECGQDADLVVMGTHGRTGLSRFLMGSVAYGTLRRATSPVLVVPSPEHAWQRQPDEERAST